MDSTIKKFHTLRNSLRWENNMLYKDKRIVAPESTQKIILETAHKGHPGIVRTKRKLRETYWWSGMDTQVESLIKRCEACQRSQKSTPANFVEPQKIPPPTEPAKHYGLDITGPFHDDRSILVLIDYHSTTTGDSHHEIHDINRDHQLANYSFRTVWATRQTHHRQRDPVHKP